MEASPNHTPSEPQDGGLERLLEGLEGVVSARVVRGADRAISEVHVLSTTAMNAKRTVRNVESAIMAATGENLDHRKISVARSGADVAPATAGRPPENPTPDVIPLRSPVAELPAGTTSDRILFDRYSMETNRNRQLAATVVVTLDGAEYTGSARGIDSEKSRLELLAKATLQALHEVVHSQRRIPGNLSLDGVNEVKAIGRCFVLVAIHGVLDRETKSLAGIAPVEDSRDSAVIAATLQATERWITGLL